MSRNDVEQKHPIISIIAVIGAMGSLFAALNTIQSQLGLGVPITALLIGLVVSGFLVYRNQIAPDAAAITWLATGLVIIVIYLIASQPATVSGQVLRDDGSPAPGVTLILTNSSGVQQRVVTDQDGSFEVSNVPDGRYTITRDSLLLYTGNVPSGWQRLVSPSINTGGLTVSSGAVVQSNNMTPTSTSLPIVSSTVTPTLPPTETDTSSHTLTPTATVSATVTETAINTSVLTTTPRVLLTQATPLSPRQVLLMTQTATMFTRTPTATPTPTRTPEPSASISSENAGQIAAIAGPIVEHISTVRSLKFSPDGRYIASSSSDNTVRIWNAETYETEWRIIDHSDWVTDIDFSDDGEYLVSVSRDGTVQIWDFGAQERLFRLERLPLWSVDFSPDGELIAFGLNDGSIEIWDLVSGQTIVVLEGHRERVLDLAFSQDGELLVSGSVNGMIKVWDVLSSSELQSLSSANDPQILAVDFNGDDSYIVSGSNSGVVRVWDYSANTRLAAFAGTIIWDLEFFPGDNLVAIASGDGSVYVWNWRTDTTLARLRGHGEAVRSVAVHPDGTSIISGGAEGDNSIIVWGISEQ